MLDLACLGAVAHAGDNTVNAGKAIENLIIDPINNDQIWGMKFYNNNAEAVYVTVNSDIAVNTSENWWSKMVLFLPKMLNRTRLTMGF